jgi:hypothetical protein
LTKKCIIYCDSRHVTIIPQREGNFKDGKF